MKPLFNDEEFDLAKADDKLLCKCYICSEPFPQLKKHIKSKYNKNKFCSKDCYSKHRTTKMSMNCTNCDVSFEKQLNQIKKSENHFCSRSCAATYNNKNKSFGTRRSKLEAWLEQELTTLYPDTLIQYNQKEAIGSELDIYIPSLNVAFELNGIFHYEPIFGVDKLQKIQKNDLSKSKACIDKQIDLCIIDASQHKYVTPKTSKKYLDIIRQIINERMSTS